MSMAQISVIGNVGREPEMSYTPDGTAVTKFSVAVTRKVKDKEETTWYNATCWRGLAETVSKYVGKGRQVFVQGELTPRSYTKRDGGSGYSLDIQVEKFQLLGKKPDTEQSQDTDNDPLGDLDDHPF